MNYDNRKGLPAGTFMADLTDNCTGGLSQSALRMEKLLLRAAMPEEERHEKSRKIARQIFSHEAWRRAVRLLIYVSFRDEVETHDIIRCALSSGKQVFCPKVCGKDMEFYQITAWQDLKPGYRGIPEPAAEVCYERRSDDKDRADTLLIAPGTVFDLSGGRIGYGGGYYDRYLCGIRENRRPVCIGICFSCQLTDKMKLYSHDIPMDIVLHA